MRKIPPKRDHISCSALAFKCGQVLFVDDKNQMVLTTLQLVYINNFTSSDFTKEPYDDFGDERGGGKMVFNVKIKRIK